MNLTLEADSLLVAGAAVLISLILFIFTILIFLRQKRLLARYRALLNGETGQDLEQILLNQEETIKHLEAQVAHLRGQIDAYSRDAQHHVQKVGMVRFNPFPDTGSDLSFAVALLDGADNGVVLSSLYGRAESRIYAKPIQNGASTYKLSEEELEAIHKARTGEVINTGTNKTK